MGSRQGSQIINFDRYRFVFVVQTLTQSRLRLRPVVPDNVTEISGHPEVQMAMKVAPPGGSWQRAAKEHLNLLNASFQLLPLRLINRFWQLEFAFILPLQDL